MGIRTVFVAGLFVAFAGFVASSQPIRPQDASHQAWVLATAKEMKTITVGMTRADLLKVFTPQGGFHTGNNGTFLSRACPYFKVDLEFSGAPTQGERNADVIAKISKPYVDDQVVID
jgi:hypothetical protein